MIAPVGGEAMHLTDVGRMLAGCLPNEPGFVRRAARDRLSQLLRSQARARHSRLPVRMPRPLTARTMLDFIDGFIAREHWPAIGASALFEGFFLLLILTLLDVPFLTALGLIHLLTSIGGVFLTVVTLNVSAGSTPERAIPLARRAVATLQLSGTALLLRGLLIQVPGPATA